MNNCKDASCEIIALANSVSAIVLYDLTFKIDLGLFSRLSLIRTSAQQAEFCNLLNKQY